MEVKSLRERIALGECVSPITVDRCLVCVDRCEAFHNQCELNKILRDSKIEKSQ